MKQAAKQIFLPGLALLLAVSLTFLGAGAAVTGTMPPWRDSVGEGGHIQGYPKGFFQFHHQLNGGEGVHRWTSSDGAPASR